ncbi:uncharacterized protein LOC135464401 [Liolophura sinensis]|uniref:uncharacterized protein LOC135464401 n=1 Tax=Liolophura sinensis TaxID=3198878 RepID=UPI0031588DB9
MVRQKVKTKEMFGSRKRGRKMRGRAGGRPKKHALSIAKGASGLNSDLVNRTESDYNSTSENGMSLAKTASQSKFDIFHGILESGPNSDRENSPTEVAKKVEINKLNGYRLVNTDFLAQIVNSVCCKVCGSANIKLFQINDSTNCKFGGGQGLNFKFEIFCRDCEDVIFHGYTSEKGMESGNEMSNFVNKRFVAACKNTGIGYNKICEFFADMNLPQPMHIKTWQKIDRLIHDVSIEAAKENMHAAAEALERDSDEAVNGLVPRVVSYDGSWQKRGHSSHYGLGCVIDVDSGVVLDTHVCSNYCHGCATVGKTKKGVDLVKWKQTHSCQKNFHGSANAADIIFKRSTDKGLMYNQVLTDGDSKAYDHVRNLKLYGDNDIQKEECVNHVAKRMYTALDKLKQRRREGKV